MIVDGQPVVVPNARGSFTTPSVVSFKVRSNKGKGKGKRKGKGQGTSSSPTGRRRAGAGAAGKRRAPVTPSSDLDLDYSKPTAGDNAEHGDPSHKPSANARHHQQQEENGDDDDVGDGGDGSRGGGLARIYVGEAAVARIATHPKNTFSSVKRIVGRTKKQAKAAGVGLGALNVDQVSQG